MPRIDKLKIPRPLFYIFLVVIVILAVGGGLYLMRKPTPPEQPPEDKYVVDLMDISYPKGTVKKVSSSKITIKTDSGLQTFVINKDTDFEFLADLQDIIENKNKGTLGDIKVGDEVSITVIVQDDGKKWAGNIVILRKKPS